MKERCTLFFLYKNHGYPTISRGNLVVLMRLISWYSVQGGCLTTSGGFGEVTSWFLENRGSYIRKAVYSLPDTSNFVQPKIARNNRQFGFESNESNISMMVLTSVYCCQVPNSPPVSWELPWELGTGNWEQGTSQGDWKQVKTEVNTSWYWFSTEAE